MSTVIRPTLGVVAISYNEERDLPMFLEHLTPWVDEIVIVDDGSTDRTKEIARAWPSKLTFIESPRLVDEYYSHQRNKGIDAAKSSWLLHMDIDERVTPQLAHEILAAIEDPSKDGYRYRRLNFVLHRPMQGGGWERWNLVHLARREKFRFGGKMHEHCLLNAAPERVGQLQGLMWHLNDESWEERMRKSLTYSVVEGAELAESGRPIRWYHFLVRPLWLSLKTYFLLRGYRDGIMGLILALHNFGAMFHWQAIAWDRRNRIPRESLEGQIRDGYARFAGLRG